MAVLKQRINSVIYNHPVVFSSVGFGAALKYFLADLKCWLKEQSAGSNVPGKIILEMNRGYSHQNKFSFWLFFFFKLVADAKVDKISYATAQKMKDCIPLNTPGGGLLERNMMGRCSFFKNLYNLLRKKFAFQYPVSELLD